MSCKRLKKTALVLEDLEPALWETLTPCLLDLVFLRLPVAQISQLRLLSKLWKAAIDSVESHFNLLLEDKIYPNMFGLIGKEKEWSRPCIWMFDVNQDQWCGREIDRSIDARFTMRAADGGLICFVSITRNEPLTMVVMNPLTRKKVELPHLLCTYDVLPTIQYSMLHLKVNRKNNQYKIFFKGFIPIGNRDNRGWLAQVYDSRTKEWSMVGSKEKSWDRILGHFYYWDIYDDYFNGKRLGPCLYDFARGRLHYYDFKTELQRCSRMSYAMLPNQLFILHTEELGEPSNLIQKGPKRKYSISQYHQQQNATSWVKGGSHGCEPFDDYPLDHHHFHLHACNGYLMVIARNYRGEVLHMWLYNLSTYKWHVLPNILKFDRFLNDGEVLMCELRWSATP